MQLQIKLQVGPISSQTHRHAATQQKGKYIKVLFEKQMEVHFLSSIGIKLFKSDKHIL